jgi:hypothetical protein
MSIHPRSDTPCTHLVVSGQRYIIFPELGECCKCCSNAGGCGILDPNWLDAAEYTGQVRQWPWLSSSVCILGCVAGAASAAARGRLRHPRP